MCTPWCPFVSLSLTALLGHTHLVGVTLSPLGASHTVQSYLAVSGFRKSMSKWGGHSKSSASHSRVVPLLHSPVLEWTAAVLSLCPRCYIPSVWHTSLRLWKVSWFLDFALKSLENQVPASQEQAEHWPQSRATKILLCWSCHVQLARGMAWKALHATRYTLHTLPCLPLPFLISCRAFQGLEAVRSDRLAI